VNEDGVNRQEPVVVPESGISTPAPLSSQPVPAVGQASGPSSAGPLTPGGSRKLGASFTARAVGIVGVAALVVVGSIIGLEVSSSSNSSRGHIPSLLTSSKSSAAAPGATITVTGSGQVEGTPDTASFTVGVDTTARTAVDALEQNNAQVAALEQSLEQSGVAVKDMQTTSLDLSANTNSRGKVVNFSADDELNVTMHDLTNLGAALDAAVQTTGNGVTLGGISFSVSNQSALLASARSQAMLAASTEATQVAAGGGLTLGPIVKITDQENAGQYLYYSNLNESAPTAGASASVPVQPGQQQISVQVTVVYQLAAS
jgi:uncharacterized protein YggE